MLRVMSSFVTLNITSRGEDCQFSMFVSQVYSQKVITARELGGHVIIATAVFAAPVGLEQPPAPC